MRILLSNIRAAKKLISHRLPAMSDIVAWHDRPAPIDEEALAYAFYALLDDSQLREVFDHHRAQ